MFFLQKFYILTLVLNNNSSVKIYMNQLLGRQPMRRVTKETNPMEHDYLHNNNILTKHICMSIYEHLLRNQPF